MESTGLKIVLAEDDDGHATLIRRNIQRAHLNAEIARVRDGNEALAFLAKEWTAKGTEQRMVLLLDIRMPVKDGIEVLRHIKSDAAMRSLPVYMLTTTDNPTEIERCFELGCNAYLTKPVSYEALSEAVQRLCAFLEISQLPGGGRR
jgi:CheY-like chemotaxis protein